jgi:hypothetical protein
MSKRRILPKRQLDMERRFVRLPKGCEARKATYLRTQRKRRRTNWKGSPAGSTRKFCHRGYFVEAPEARQKRNKGLIAGPCKSVRGGTSCAGLKSLLYHAFGVKGFRYLRTRYEGGEIIFELEPEKEPANFFEDLEAFTRRRGRR